MGFSEGKNLKASSRTHKTTSAYLISVLENASAAEVRTHLELGELEAADTLFRTEIALIYNEDVHAGSTATLKGHTDPSFNIIRSVGLCQTHRFE